MVPFFFWSLNCSQVTWPPWCPQWYNFFATPRYPAKFEVNSACVTWYTKFSLHSLSDLGIVHKSHNNHDGVTDIIPLSPQHIWQSLKSILQVELEIQSLVLILYLVCKLYLSHVVSIMTSSIQIYVIPTYLTKFEVKNRFLILFGCLWEWLICACVKEIFKKKMENVCN